MLLAHLVHDSAFHFAAERLSLVEVAQQAELPGLLKVRHVVLSIRALEELVQECQPLVLLHGADFDTICEVVHRGLRLVLAPDFGLEDFDVK